MCTVCGCGDEHSHEHTHDHTHEHTHEHSLDGHHHDYGQGPAHAHAPGLTQSRMLEIERNILGKNDEYARSNRKHLADLGTLCLNLVSSPGSGKTQLLTETLKSLVGKIPLAVIEGDQATSQDAERIRATGVDPDKHR